MLAVAAIAVAAHVNREIQKRRRVQRVVARRESERRDTRIRFRQFIRNFQQTNQDQLLTQRGVFDGLQDRTRLQVYVNYNPDPRPQTLSGLIDRFLRRRRLRNTMLANRLSGRDPTRTMTLYNGESGRNRRYDAQTRDPVLFYVLLKRVKAAIIQLQRLFRYRYKYGRSVGQDLASGGFLSPERMEALQRNFDDAWRALQSHKRQAATRGVEVDFARNPYAKRRRYE